MGTLYLVGTPIGNLDDITLRALRVLREVPLIAAEDTRATRRLLDHFDIHQPLVSYYEHNERARVGFLLERLGEGDVALVSEAGMPGISDPGFDLVRAAIGRGIRVEPIPGPSAPIAALAASGLPTNQFVYLGFLPRKPTERRRALAGLRTERRTVVAFEAPHRLVATLRDIAAELGARPIVVARELTKLHEEFVRGTADGALAHFELSPPRGEITLVIGGESENAEVPADDLATRIAALRDQGLAAAEIAVRVARETGASRRRVYQLLLGEGHCAKM